MTWQHVREGRIVVFVHVAVVRQVIWKPPQLMK